MDDVPDQTATAEAERATPNPDAAEETAIGTAGGEVLTISIGG